MNKPVHRIFAFIQQANSPRFNVCGLKSLLCFALALGLAGTARGAPTTNIYSTAGNYTFAVPGGVNSVIIKAWGAGGGSANGGNGGGAGFVNATLSVTPGDTLYVLVGGGGGAGTSASSVGQGGGGGGRSAVTNSGGTLVIAAGGGGGGGSDNTANSHGGAGGAGGGLTGTAGSAAASGLGTGGGGGTQTAGGSGGTGGGTGYSGVSGSSLAGGAGGSSTTAPNTGNGGSAGSGGGGAGGNYNGAACGGGGGGGSGLYGGGGGGGNQNGTTGSLGNTGGGGGGGASYTNGLATGVTITGGSSTTAGGTGDADYAGSAGQGGSGGATGASGSAGSDGRVVIITVESGGGGSTPTVANAALASVSTNSATFNGTLSSTGSAACAVCVLWGKTDGGTNWDTWANTNWFNGGNPDPIWTNGTAFSTNITPLDADSNYYYTYAATNTSGNAIASPSKYFITGYVTVEATDSNAQWKTPTIDTGTFAISRPAGATNGNLSVAYSVTGQTAPGAHNLPSGSVTILAGQTSTNLTLTPTAAGLGDAVLTLTVASTNPYPIGAMNCATVTIQAAVLPEFFVATNGNDGAAGTDWSTALLTISNGVAKAAAAGAGSIVTISNGTYTITETILINTGITVRSFGGGAYGGLANASNTIVKQTAGTKKRVFMMTNTTAGCIQGLTIRDGNGDDVFRYRPGDVSAAWTNLGAVDVQFRGWWISSRAHIRGIDEAAGLARLDRNTRLSLMYAPGDGIDYVVENVLEALEEPGEWVLDPVARCVWYAPKPGERPEAVEAVAGGIESLLELRDAKFIRFEGLTFAHAEWRPEAGNPVAEQSSAFVPGAVLAGSGCEGIVFDGCRIEHVGGYGLECADGAREIVFSNGTIRDLGAGGVKIWHGCRRCVVEGSEIADGGHVWMSGAGVLIGKATGNTLTHCHIHDFYYTGVSVGWTWGYAESDAYGNVIEWNHIHDLGKGLLSDMGGVYLLGNAPGTRVRHNRIHDIRTLRYGGWGIYPDEGSSDLLIENNLCYRCDREAFFQHYGRNNIVRNNIFAHGGEAVIGYGWINSAPPAIVFEHNILVARGTPIVRRVDPGRWRADQVRLSGNLYWREDDGVLFAGGWINLATQPFKGRIADEAPRFRPLPADGAAIRSLCGDGQGEKVFGNAGEFRFAMKDGALTVTGVFAGSPGTAVEGQPPWGDWRAHIDLWLKPFPFLPAMARFSLASNGDRAVQWTGCAAASAVAWDTAVLPAADAWSVRMTVPLEAVADWVRRCAGVPSGCVAEWRGMAAVTLPVEPLDFEGWRRHAGDRAGVLADPGFADPRMDDFRLRPDSAARALGFVPFDCPH